MHKHEILTRLHQIVADRLFGREWLADSDACAAVQTSLVKMGLQEEERPNEWRNTSLGKELNVDLFMVFMGLWTASDMPMILEHHGLLDAPENDRDEIWPSVPGTPVVGGDPQKDETSVPGTPVTRP